VRFTPAARSPVARYLRRAVRVRWECVRWGWRGWPKLPWQRLEQMRCIVHVCDPQLTLTRRDQSAQVRVECLAGGLAQCSMLDLHAHKGQDLQALSPDELAALAARHNAETCSTSKLRTSSCSGRSRAAMPPSVARWGRA
jgi:hypothetical protein